MSVKSGAAFERATHRLERYYRCSNAEHRCQMLQGYSGREFVVMRYQSNDQLDDTFGGGGIVKITSDYWDIGSTDHPFDYAVELLARGNIAEARQSSFNGEK